MKHPTTPLHPRIAANNVRNASRTAKLEQAVQVRRALGHNPTSDRYEQVAEQFGIGESQVRKMERLGGNSRAY